VRARVPCVDRNDSVRDNIANFGGDPANVTIFGQSGGGGKVSALMAMPQAKGLYHRAIVQSGSMRRVLTTEFSANLAAAVLKEAGANQHRPLRSHDRRRPRRARPRGPHQSCMGAIRTHRRPEPQQAAGVAGVRGRQARPRPIARERRKARRSRAARAGPPQRKRRPRVEYPPCAVVPVCCARWGRDR
jgi:hypothetical protein